VRLWERGDTYVWIATAKEGEGILALKKLLR